MKSGVYRIYCFKNKKSYIGSSTNVNSRINSHKSLLRRGKHHSMPLQMAYNKYGVDSFYFYIIDYCCVDKILDVEKHYIDFYKSVAPLGFNIEENPKINNHTEDVRLKMSKNRLGENNSFYGKRHSDETKKKISESRTGKHKVTESYREKLRRSSARKKLSNCQVVEILNSKLDAKELSKLYGVSRNYIYDLKNGKRRSYVTKS
jgi:group I intron endonuclease